MFPHPDNHIEKIEIKLPGTESHETSENLIAIFSEVKSLDDRNIRDFEEIMSSKGRYISGSSLEHKPLKGDQVVLPEQKVTVTPREPSKTPRERSASLKAARHNAKEDLEKPREKKIEDIRIYGLLKNQKLRKFAVVFTESSYFRLFEIGLVLTNTAAYCLIDYSDRHFPGQDSQRQRISFYLELGCNITYVLVLIFKVLAVGLWDRKDAYLRSPFNIFNLCIIAASFLALIPVKSASAPFKVIRLCRPLLLIQLIKPIKKTFIAFCKTLFSIREILFQISFLILFFSIFGLHLFQGLLESRCRFTPEPVDGLWPANPEIHELCGTHLCPEGNYCENPSLSDFPFNHTEVDIEPLNYGLSTFDTIFNALLNGLNFFTFTGWSKIMDIYWTAYNKIIVAGYSIIFVFFVGLVMMNLLMASLYEAFVSHSSSHHKHDSTKKTRKTFDIKEELEQMERVTAGLNNNDKQQVKKPMQIKASTFKHKKPGKSEVVQTEFEDSMFEKSGKSVPIEIFYKGFTFTTEPLENPSTLRRLLYGLIVSTWFRYTIIALLLVDIVVLASDNADISASTLAMLDKIDFAITWIFAIEILARLIIFQPRKFFSNYFDIMDLVIIGLNVGSIVWDWIHNVEQFGALYTSGSVIECLKFLRVFRFVVGNVFWKRGAILFMEMILSLYKVKDFIAFSGIVGFIFALIGRELFAYRVFSKDFETEEGTISLSEDRSPRINFNEIGEALIATSLVFLNEEWQVIMFQHERGVSHTSALFFVIVLLFGTVCIMRMFMMLFINSLLHSQNIKNLFKMRNFIRITLDFLREKAREIQSKWRPTGPQNLMILSNGDLQNNPNPNTEQKEAKPSIMENNSYPPGEIQPLTKQKGTLTGQSDTYTPAGLAGETLKDEKEFSNPKLPSNNQVKDPIIVRNPSGLVPKVPSMKLLAMKESVLSSGKSPSGSPMKGSLKKKEMLKMQMTRYNNKILDLEGKSLYLFGKDCKFRQFIHKVINHKLFEKVIIAIIAFSIVLLIIANPMNDPNSFLATLLYIGDCLVLLLYFLEILMKIISYGLLLNGPHSFMLDLWNSLDILIFILTVLGTVDTRFKFSQYDFKWCRTLRIFKLIQYNPGLKKAMYNLFLSIPDIISLWIYYLMNLLFFGMIATKTLKSTLNFCAGVEEEMISQVLTKTDCFDHGGDWLKRDLNFDKISESISSLFQISTTEGWMELMFEAWDHVGPNKSPIADHSKTMAVFYLAFFTIANVILMNTIVGILVETYLFQKEKNDPASKYSEHQKEWAKIKEFIYKLQPKKVRPPPKNPFRLKIRQIIKSKAFIRFILFITLLNILLFMLYWHRQPKAMKTSLDYINAVFVGIFTVEIIMNLIAQGPSVFIRKVWNLFDILIIICSWAGFALILQPRFEDLRWVHALANCIQVLRIIRLIKKVRFLRKLFSVFLSILPQIKNIFLLMFLFFVTYGIVGVNFFAFLKPQETVGGEEIHFRNFFMALVNLAKITTAEEWFKILVDCSRKVQPNFVCFKITHYNEYQQHGLMGCGNSVAYLYFFSYLIINSLLILNLFVAMILNAAEEHKRSRTQTNDYRIDQILDLWKTFDPQGLGYMNSKIFYRFYKMTAIQLGLEHEDFLDPENRMMFLRFCSIPLYEHVGEKIYCVRFHDCVMKLAQMAVFLNQGKKELEPTDGFQHLLKYELRLIQNKDFELSPFKADEIEKLRKVYKAMQNFRRLPSKRLRKIMSFSEIVNLVIADVKERKKIGVFEVEINSYSRALSGKRTPKGGDNKKARLSNFFG